MSIIQYELTLLEPVLVTAPGGDPNTGESQDHIPGGAVLGALTRQYQKNVDVPADFTRLFLDGSTRFLNAYLAHEGTRFLPTPQHWVKKKDDPNEESTNKVYDVTRVDDLSMPKPAGKPFMTVSGDTAFLNSPLYEVAVHNARNREMGRAIANDLTNRSALFRYHALAKGQTFIGTIVTQTQQDADILLALLTNNTIMLGGSSTAGYGRTQITQVAILADNQLEMPPSDDIPADSSFLVYLTSDAIVRHPESAQTGCFLAEALEKALSNPTLTVEKVLGRSGWVGGFNQYWGLPLPQSYALLKGSIWQMHTQQAIVAADIQKVVMAGVGSRKAEGFGALVINPQWPDSLTVSEVAPVPKKSRNEVVFTALSENSSIMLAFMNKRIAQQELDRQLAAVVTNINKGGLRRLSNSQLSRLRLKIRQESNYPDDQFKRFQHYLQGTKARKSADDQFRKSRLGSKNFRDWLYDLTQQPDRVWQELKLPDAWQETNGQWQRPLLGTETFHLNAELAHHYTIRLIDAVCEQAAQGRRE